MKVGLYEAKNRLSELIKAAEAGQEVLITKRGSPSVKLVPTPEEPDAAVELEAALERAAEVRRAIAARGHVVTWVDIKRARDEGRP